MLLITFSSPFSSPFPLPFLRPRKCYRRVSSKAGTNSPLIMMKWTPSGKYSLHLLYCFLSLLSFTSPLSTSTFYCQSWSLPFYQLLWLWIYSFHLVYFKFSYSSPYKVKIKMHSWTSHSHSYSSSISFSLSLSPFQLLNSWCHLVWIVWLWSPYTRDRLALSVRTAGPCLRQPPRAHRVTHAA